MTNICIQPLLSATVFCSQCISVVTSLSRNLLEIKKNENKKNNPCFSRAQALEQHKWKDLKAICWSSSPAAISHQFLQSPFEQGTVGVGVGGQQHLSISITVAPISPVQSAEIGRWSSGHRKCLRFHLDSHHMEMCCSKYSNFWLCSKNAACSSLVLHVNLCHFYFLSDNVTAPPAEP